MRITHIDWGSDPVIFFAALFAIAIVVAVAMERVSPKRQKRRRISRQGNKAGGELID